MKTGQRCETCGTADVTGWATAIVVAAGMGMLVGLTMGDDESPRERCFSAVRANAAGRPTAAELAALCGTEPLDPPSEAP